MPLTARPLSAYGAYVANGQIVAPTNPRFTQAVALGWNWVERLDSDTFDTLVSNRMHLELATKPVAVVMYPSTDFNGAFLRGPMRELMQAYHVMYYEIGADTDVDTCMQDAARAGPVHLAVLGGHGSEHMILVGEQGEAGRIDIGDDRKLLRAFAGVVPGGSIVLDSCSTGRGDLNVAMMFARLAPQAHIFAPQVDAHKDSRPVLDPFGRFLWPGYLDAQRNPAPTFHATPTAASWHSATQLFGR